MHLPTSGIIFLLLSLIAWVMGDDCEDKHCTHISNPICVTIDESLRCTIANECYLKRYMCMSGKSGKGFFYYFSLKNIVSIGLCFDFKGLEKETGFCSDNDDPVLNDYTLHSFSGVDRYFEDNEIWHMIFYCARKLMKFSLLKKEELLLLPPEMKMYSKTLFLILRYYFTKFLF
ncbi:hypothetical protein FF38_02062 [Lucilia cuprina]|uniref:Kazal-like domain-containing protein n=1 Tax=Lucilia cuprina TaxID=7375 RepID=A0A0L0BW76_LUCCU|nr:hypothetical protein FF38_02062 [Lucilia cuprina]